MGYKNEDRQWLYNVLQTEGYDVGSYDEFEKSLQIKEDADWYFDEARKLGLEIGDRSEFDALMGLSNAKKSEGTPLYAMSKESYGGALPTLEEQTKPNSKLKFGKPGFIQDEATALHPMSDTSVAERLSNPRILDENNNIRAVQEAEEEDNINKIFVSKPMNTPKDVYDNYSARFTNTQRGIELGEELASITKGIQDKYLKEYLGTGSYKALAEKYQGEELAKQASEQFARMYGEVIEAELEPYQKAYNDELNLRYGSQMEGELNRISKNEAGVRLGELSSSVDSELENIEEKIEARTKAVRNVNWTPGMPSSRDDNTLKELRGQRTYLNGAKELIEESQKIIQAAKDAKDGTAVGGVLRGVRDTAFDIDTWTMGLSDLVGGMRLNNILEKVEKGEKLTSAEEMLFDASVNNMAINYYYQNELGKGYMAGQITGESLPFMLEMIINPISASGNVIAKRLLNAGLKKFAKNKAAQVGARLVGDATAAIGMSSTTGIPSIIGDTYRRMNENYNYGVDAEGNLYANKKADAMGMGEAFARSFTTRAIENQSEMIFNAFKGVGGFMKGVQDVIPGGVNGFFNMLSLDKVADAYRWLKNSPVFRNYLVKDVRNATQIGGIFEEYAEEVYNNLANFAIGEMSWDDVVSLDKNIDTFLGLAPTQVMFGILGLGGAASMRYQTRKTLEDLQATMNEQQRKELEGLLDMGIDAKEVDVRGFIRGVMENQNYTIENKRDLIKAAYYVAQQRSIDELTEADVIDKVNAENQFIDSMTDPSTGNYAELSRNVINPQTGESEQQKGYVVGWIGEGEKRQPIFVADGMENNYANRVVLKPTEWSMDSYREMPAEQVKAVNEEMNREEAAQQAEREAKYAPEVLNAQMEQGVPFETEDAIYVPISPMLEGNGWVVEVQPKGVNNKSAARPFTEELTNDQFHDILQAQIDAQEAAAIVNAPSSENVGEEANTEENTPVDNENVQPVAEGVVPEQQAEEVKQHTLEEVVATLPKTKNNEIDYKAMTPQQQYQYTSLTESPEVALEDLQADIAAGQEEITKKQEKLSKARGGERAALRDEVRKLTQAQAELQAFYESIAPKQEEVANEESVEPIANTSEEAIDEPKVAEVKSEQPKVKKPTKKKSLFGLKKKDSEFTEEEMRPMNAIEFAASHLASGNIAITTESFKRETGYGEAERKKFMGMLRTPEKGGMTIEQAAEKLVSLDNEQNGHFFEGDTQAARDTVIELLGYETWGDVANLIKNNRTAERKKREEAEYAEYEAYLMEALHVTPEELELQKEYDEQNNPFPDVSEEEYFAKFAEKAQEYINYLNSYSNEQGRTDEVAGRNDSLLSEERAGDIGGNQRSESERESKEVGSESIHDSETSQESTSGIEVAPSIEETNVSRMADIEAEILDIDGRKLEIEDELNELGNSDLLAKAALIDELSRLDELQVELQAEYSGLYNMNEESRAIIEEEGGTPLFRQKGKRAKADKKPFVERAKHWEEKTGVKIRIANSLRDVKNRSAFAQILRGSQVTGWFEESTGEVVLYMPHIASIEEVDTTFIHEVVAHKGLRGLLGEQFNKFLDEVWNMMSRADQAKYLNYPGVNGNERAAADEYIANTFETIDVTESAWSKLTELIKRFLKAIGLEPKMTNADIANAIKKSYQRLLEGEGGASVAGEGTRFSVVEQASNEFNKQLDDFKNKTHRGLLSLGAPQEILRKIGVNVNEITISPTILHRHLKKHHLEVEDLKGLASAIQNPILSYKHGKRFPNLVIVTEMDVKGGKLSVTLELDENGSVVEISNVKSVHSKEALTELQRLSELSEEEFKNSLKWVEKEKVSEWLLRLPYEDERTIDNQKLNSIANIINSFENPKTIEDKSPSFRVIEDKNGRKSLVGLHNISEEKLRKAIKQGGLANPSMAVIDMDKQSHVDYGDITLVAPESLVDKKLGKNIGTYLADAYTPIYPTVVKQMTDKGYKAFNKALDNVNEFFRSKVRSYFNSYLDTGTIYDALYYWYLSDTGKNPPTLEAALPGDFTREEVDKVKSINPEADSFFQLSEEDKQKALSLYAERFYNGIEAYKEYLADYVRRMREVIKDESKPAMVRNRIQRNLIEIENYGFEYDYVAAYYNRGMQLASRQSKPSDVETFSNARNEVIKAGLNDEFNQWLASKESDLGVEEKLFKGYDNQGRAKYVPNTLENASKLMKKEGRAGATGFGGFNKFISVVAPVVKTTKDINKKKQNLSTQEAYEEFTKKWSDVYHYLAQRLQPAADKYADYGYYRLEEMPTVKNPKEYVKKEYGIDLSDEFMQKYNDFISAIKNDFPARYFETKFERPVYLNEFAAAVIPQGTSKDIVSALKESGLPVEEYEKGNNESRMAAVDKVASEVDGIRFRVANKNQEIFVSNAQRAVEGIKQEKGTPGQWLAMIEKNGGLKAGEDKWLGLSDWLKASDAKTITKDEILDFIGENKIRIEEVKYAAGGGVEALRDKYPSFDDAFEVYESPFGVSIDIKDNKKAAEIVFDIQSKDNPYAAKYEVDEYEDFVDNDAEFEIKERIEYAIKYEGATPINPTRLEYTTEGLDNKQEIALTIPTIEPWNVDDEIHFGDAGDGRAVAWIRFGETYVMEEDNFTREVTELKDPYRDVNGLDIYKTGSGSNNDFIAHGKGRNGEMIYVAFVNGKQIPVAHKTLDDAKAEMNKFFKEHPIKNRKRLNVLVIDEIQSKRHQEGREKGYKPNPDIYLKENGIDVVESGEFYEFYKNGELDKRFAKSVLNNNINKAKDLYVGGQLKTNIPEAPFEKNWSELAFKRMLRYAAENGFDKVAWTKGAQQAERYSLSNVIDSISISKSRREGGKYHVTSWDKETMPIGVASGNKTPEELKDLFGKEIAQSLIEGVDNLEEGSDTFVLEGADLEVGGEGMKGFYDKILPSFVNKYVKKWGTKVQDIELPNVEEAGRIMHSVDVTDAMKESVMEGQTMFRLSEHGKKIQLEADKFTSKYNSKPVIVLESSMTDDEIERMMEGYSAKEIRDRLEKKSKGGYSRLIDKIYIFAENNSLDEIEDTLFHENLHVMFGRSPLVGELYANVKAKNNKADEDLFEHYNSKDVSEELFVSLLAQAMVYGKLNNAAKYLSNESREQLLNTLKDFGYDNEFESERRRRSLSSRSADENQEGPEGTRAMSYSQNEGGRGTETAKEGTDGLRPGNGGLRTEGSGVQGASSKKKRASQSEQLKGLFGRVADMGLDGVLGNKEYVNAMVDMYKVLPEAVQREVADEALSRYGGDVAPAVSDWLNHKAEASVWDKVVAVIREALRKVGFNLDLNTNEAKYVLWRSQKPLNRNNLLEVAEDIDMKYRLKVGEYSPAKSKNVMTQIEQAREEVERDPTDAQKEAGNYRKGHIELDGFDITIENPKGGVRSGTDKNGKKWSITMNNDYGYFRGTEAVDGDHIDVFLSENPSEGRVYVVDQRNDDGSFDESKVMYGFNSLEEARDAYLSNYEKGWEKHIMTVTEASKEDFKKWIASSHKKVKPFSEYKVFKAEKEDTRFRIGNKLNVRDEYEATIKKGGFQAREAVQDAMLSLRKFQELIEKVSGKKIRDFENAWMHENRLSSVVQAQIHEMERKFYKPMMDAVKKLMSVASLEQEQVADYLMLKHGIERNREMAVRKALTDSEGKIDRTRLEQWYQDKRNVRSRAATPHLDTWRKQQEELDNIALMYGADMSRDYSGLTSMFGTDDLADSTQQAYDEVEALETAYPAETEVLGKAIKAMTQNTLDESFGSGLMDRKVYDELSKDMYDYYIPLRGFDETTSEEVYAYLDQDRGAFNAPLIRAKGRSSKSDNPIAYLKSIAESGIMQGERNKMKQSFLNLVINNPSDLVSVREGVWVIYNPASGEWEAAAPPAIPNNATPADVEAAMEAWEANMESLAASDPNVKKVSEAQDIPYRVVGNRMNQHQVIVKRLGKSYTLTINGNPRLAMALNGLTNPNNKSNDGKVAAYVSSKIDSLNRTLSAWYTTRNPDFVASNFMRDTFYTNTIVRAKEGNAYANKFHKNYGKVLPQMLILFSKYEKGMLNPADKTEAAFLDFMMNGGETGYSNLKDLEHIKKQIAKELKESKWDKAVTAVKLTALRRENVEALAEKIDILNRAVENTARFAAFLTSREEGRSIAKSIFDAKEISVNFNKKGAGGTFFGMTGQTWFGNLAAMVGAGGRALYVFFNAAVQGTTNLMHVMKVNPKGTSAGLAAMFLMGAVVPFLFGGDDDDKKDYYDLPEHVRRNHLIIPGAGDAWISIPLPIEYRIMYGMGELLSSWRTGHERGSDIAKKMLNLTGQALPLNFLEEGLDAFVPSAISPIWQVYNNRSWTGLPIYKDNEFNKDDPEYTKAFKNTDRGLVKFTKALYEWTFDEESQEEGIDMNPAVIETLAKGYFGGLATQLSNIMKVGGMIAGEQEFDWRNIPIGNRILKTGDERTKEKRVTNEYFENMEKLDFLQSRERMLKKVINGPSVPQTDKDKAKIDDEIMRGSDVYKKYQEFKKQKKEVDKIRKTIKEKGSTPELEKKLMEAQEAANKAVR